MPSKPSVSDIVKQLRDLAEKATPGPYHVVGDTADDCPDHKNSGLAMLDTGRVADWPPARLLEWQQAEYLAALDPATMLQLLDVVDAAQACVDSVKSEWCGRVADEFGGHEDDWATWWDDSKAVAMFTALRRLKEKA